MADKQPLVYTVREAAAHLKVSPWTINRLIQLKELGSIQLGARRLIPSVDLDAFIARLRDEQDPLEAHRG